MHEVCRVPPSATDPRDYSYLGLTERLTREGTGTGAKSYDYAATGERLGIKARATVGSTTLTRFRPYVEDAQSNTVALEHHPDDSGGMSPTAPDRYQLDPYGATTNDAELSQAAKDNPFRYQGHYLDPRVGTYDMQARAYRPTLQRFLSQDRYADPTADLALQGDPLTNNRYAFLSGNPVGQVDVDGHDSHAIQSSCESNHGTNCGERAARSHEAIAEGSSSAPPPDSDPVVKGPVGPPPPKNGGPHPQQSPSVTGTGLLAGGPGPVNDIGNVFGAVGEATKDTGKSVLDLRQRRDSADPLRNNRRASSARRLG